MKHRVFDAFPWGGSPTELLLLECRLVELYDAVDAFIIVEADVDHQGHGKPYHYLENEARFSQWADKIVYVKATGLPTVEEDPGSWAREVAQREFIVEGLKEVDAQPDDILLHSDADEIPRAVYARNVRPQGSNCIGFHQRGHFWAIDWDYPPGWNGTVAARVEYALEYGPGKMRLTRNSGGINRLPNSGWHFSWLGGPEAWDYKCATFCHPEVLDRIRGDNGERRWREGVHVDHIKMTPVDVDKTWPVWMQDPANVPESWYRPR